MVEGKFGWAIAEYERALELYPDFPDYLYNIGLAAGSARNYKKAENSYRALLKIIPDHFQARYNLGKLYQVQEMLDEAIAEFHKILALRPQIINISLGHLYRKKWEKESEKEWLIRSQSHFKEALAKDENNTEAQKNLEFIQNILSGKIQAVIIQSTNHDRIKKIAEKINKMKSFLELKAIIRQYKDEAKITFNEKESLGKKLWDNLSSLSEGELSPIIFHQNRYFIFFRIIVPPERNL
jgi:tetratricopeptide (TPR) repeat protein